MFSRILTLVAAMAVLILATLTLAAQSLKHENTQGCYIVPAGDRHYKVINHVLYANAEGQWYSLRAPQYDRGFVRGQQWTSPESWVKVGGSRITTYRRTPRSFRNTDDAPVMQQN